MNLDQLTQSIAQLGAMRDQYNQSLSLPPLLQEAVQESLLHRFEYTVEGAWKSGKRYLVEYEGFDREMGPKTVIRLCGQLGLLDAESWLSYLQARQMIAHDYSEDKANNVVLLVNDFYRAVCDFRAVLSRKIAESGEAA